LFRKPFGVSMMTWKVSSLRGFRDVGSAKERFCFFDMAAECERR
jgi:hypothetical protein